MAYTQEKRNKEPEKRIVSTKQVNCGKSTVECREEDNGECCNKESEGISGAVNLTVNVASNNSDYKEMPYNYSPENNFDSNNSDYKEIPYNYSYENLVFPHIQGQYPEEPVNVPMVMHPLEIEPVVYENKILQDDKGNYFIISDDTMTTTMNLPKNIETKKQVNTKIQEPKKTKFNAVKSLNSLNSNKNTATCIESFYPEFL